jgi:hypothetical protein
MTLWDGCDRPCSVFDTRMEVLPSNCLLDREVDWITVRVLHIGTPDNQVRGLGENSPREYA